MKFPSLLFPFNKALIYCYFPWYLVARTMAKVESDRPDRNQFNTALVEDDLHSLTRLQIKGFPNGLRDNYVKFW